MSMCICKYCDAYIDSDDDPECFVEVGNMRRLNETIIVCEACRDRDERDRIDYEMNPPDMEG